MPKLPKGMFRREDRPGWYVRTYRGGRERWVSVGTDFKKAEAKAKAVLRGETRLGSSRLTVREAADRWVESYIRLRRTESGQKLAAQRVRDFFDPFMGHVLLERVTGEDVRSFRLWLERTTQLSVTSVWHVLSDLRCLLNWCEDAELVDGSPFPAKVMPRLQERPPDRLTDEEADRLRGLPDPHGFVCRLALGTGLRWGELCRVQASDVERGFLVVHRTKSGKVRRVPLSPKLAAEVRGRVGRLVGFAVVSPGSFAKAVRRATGIERFHVHQMRHTFACQWLERDGSIVALQQILGHKSVVTTQRYAGLTDDVVMREAERIAGVSGQDA